MKLDVVIATYSPEGIKRVAEMPLPVVKDVGYIVSWQESRDASIPVNLLRSDVRIYRMEGKGLSRNRNNAISHSGADLIYIADDDIEILPDALTTIIKRFEEFPDTQVAAFKMKETGRKVYPEGITDLGFYLPKGFHIVSYQLAFRRDLFPSLKFSEKYGINSGVFEVGEDEIFHLTARKLGLKCRFFPDVIASHPHDASGGKRITDPRAIQGFGAVITKSFPKTFLLRLPLKAWRLRKSGQSNFLFSLWHLFAGSFKSLWGTGS